MQIVDHHPLATGSVGAVSGFTSWLLANSSEIQSVAGILGSVFGALTAILTCLLLALKIIFGLRDRRRAEAAARAMVAKQTDAFGDEFGNLP